MPGKTTISWTDKTWNPVTGCDKVSPGCKNCYAERTFDSLADSGFSVYAGRKFSDVQCHNNRLFEPLKWSDPCRVFVNSMSDLFHEAVPDEFILRVFCVMARCPHITFTILTKRADRMFRFFDRRTDDIIASLVETFFLEPQQGNIFDGELPGIETFDFPLPNVELGVSVENEVELVRRVPALQVTPAAVRVVSYEPALAKIYPGLFMVPIGYYSPIDQIIVGGESGPNARAFDLDWAYTVKRHCIDQGCAFFMKQIGSNAWHKGERFRTRDRKGEDPAEWPEDLRVREFAFEK